MITLDRPTLTARALEDLTASALVVGVGTGPARRRAVAAARAGRARGTPRVAGAVGVGADRRGG
ncbi:hypothetical protein [Micrococcus luteus]|uniref:hypothetical protein n=1 Tax=Micrococcus luteus TaxID=1270 RepID=UPI001F0D8EC2|nr:hypothetical protein [Micrococcus luteus]